MNEEYTNFILDDTTYSTKLTKNFESRKKYVKDNPNEIRAYIPGSIVDLFIKPGQKIREHDSLLILEAMKMKNDVVMPFDGIIKEVKVEIGSKVEKNQLLIIIEPA